MTPTPNVNKTALYINNKTTNSKQNVKQKFKHEIKLIVSVYNSNQDAFAVGLFIETSQTPRPHYDDIHARLPHLLTSFKSCGLTVCLSLQMFNSF